MLALFGTMVGFMIACAILGVAASRSGAATTPRPVGISDPGRRVLRRR